MLQIHDNGCLEGPWRENGEKAMPIRICSFHFNSVRNAASSEGRALGTCSVGMMEEREHLL